MATYALADKSSVTLAKKVVGSGGRAVPGAEPRRGVAPAETGEFSWVGDCRGRGLARLGCLLRRALPSVWSGRSGRSQIWGWVGGALPRFGR